MIPAQRYQSMLRKHRDKCFAFPAKCTAALMLCTLLFLACAPATKTHVPLRTDPASHRAVFLELVPQGKDKDEHHVYDELVQVFIAMGYQILRVPTGSGYLICEWAVPSTSAMKSVVEVRLIDSSTGEIVYSAEGSTGTEGSIGNNTREAARLAIEGFRVGRGADQPRMAVERQPKAVAKNVVTSGTGVILCPAGLISTNYHVITQSLPDGGEQLASRLTIRLPDARGEVSASVLRLDRSNDLAILQAPEAGNLVRSSLTYRTSENFGQGIHITAIGHPLVSVLGTEARITDGVVSSKFGMGDDPRLLQISAPIQPGNSGGPLFDDSGNLVGIVVATLTGTSPQNVPQNVNFAVKSDYLVSLLRSVPTRYSSCLGDEQPLVGRDREEAIRFYGNRTVMIIAEFIR